LRWGESKKGIAGDGDREGGKIPAHEPKKEHGPGRRGGGEKEMRTVREAKKGVRITCLEKGFTALNGNDSVGRDHQRERTIRVMGNLQSYRESYCFCLKKRRRSVEGERKESYFGGRLVEKLQSGKRGGKISGNAEGNGKETGQHLVEGKGGGGVTEIL